MEMGFIADKSIAYEQLPCTAVAALTVANLTGCTKVVITPELQAVRWRDDGVDPTAAIGMPLAVGSTLEYTAAQLLRLRFISQVAGGLLNITYYSQT
jgi:hypothetical protein